MSTEQGMTEAPEQQASQAEGQANFGGSGGYELDEDGQRVPHGMGQSKSSRRRRRKRKGKGSEGGEGQAEGGDAASGPAAVNQGVQAGGQAGSPQAAPPAAHTGGQQGGATAGQGQGGFRQNNGQQGGQGRGFQQNGGHSFQAGGAAQQNGAPGGTKRWKKKFRDRDRPRGPETPGTQQTSQGSSGGSTFAGNQGGGFRGPDTHQPGNNSFKRKGGFGGGGGGGKRQSGGRSFVGPMDHSYRPVNGNIFDTAQAPVESHGNFGNGGGGRSRSFHQGGDAQPIDYSQGKVIPIAADAPTKIYFFIEDLFFTAKIQETARKLGVKVAFIKNEKEQIATLTDAKEDERPGLIVFDLNNANAKPMTLIPKLKTKLKKSTSIIGFLSHLQGDLKAKAVEAGCDTVMPRAAFSQNLPNLLRRYGIEDVEEPNFNQ